MKYSHYLVADLHWVIGVLPDGSTQILTPPGYDTASGATTRASTPPIALPGQKVWVIKSREIREVWGVHWTNTAGYWYQVTGIGFRSRDLQSKDIIPLCS